MPYKSDAQVGFMHAKHPEIAKRWDKKYGVPKNLPRHVKKKKRSGSGFPKPDRNGFY